MPFNADDVRRLLEQAITEAMPGQVGADKIAATLAPTLAPALDALAPDVPASNLMTAAEALFVRDAIASELPDQGGQAFAERLLKAGYIDVRPILSMHRQAPAASTEEVAAATGPVRVPASPMVTGNLPRPLTGPNPSLA